MKDGITRDIGMLSRYHQGIKLHYKKAIQNPLFIGALSPFKLNYTLALAAILATQSASTPAHHFQLLGTRNASRVP
jgi:hypothetical protein